MKQIVNRFAILTLALIFSIGAMTACSASEKSVNEKDSGGTEQINSPANIEMTADDKLKGNKTVVENKNVDSTAKNQQTETKEFSEAENTGEDKMSGLPSWKIIYGSDQIKIDSKGRGKRVTSTNVTRETDFSLPLQNSDTLDRIFYFTKYKDDWIFLYETTNFDAGSGSIVRLDGKTLKPKWSAALGSFNIGKGLIENQFAYLGALGFAGKIDLDSGKYVWKHDDFYRKYNKKGAFNFFDVPKFDGETVVFTELENNAPTNSIIFDKASGKVIKANVK